MPHTVPAHHKDIAKHLATVYGVKPRVEVWKVDQGTSAQQPIAIFENFPSMGITSYSTVGLSDHGGSEIATAGLSKNANFVKVLFDLAALILDGDRQARPGESFEKLVSRIYSSSNTGHILLLPNSPLKTDIPPLELAAKKIQWLFAFPITSEELFTSPHANQFLESCLSHSAEELLDLNRKFHLEKTT